MSYNALNGMKHGQWAAAPVASPAQALKPQICKCGSRFTIDDGDGIGPRCGVCGKRKK